MTLTTIGYTKLAEDRASRFSVVAIRYDEGSFIEKSNSHETNRREVAASTRSGRFSVRLRHSQVSRRANERADSRLDIRSNFRRVSSPRRRFLRRIETKRREPSIGRREKLFWLNTSPRRRPIIGVDSSSARADIMTGKVASKWQRRRR